MIDPLGLYKQGLIPGPKETEAGFLKRVQSCQVCTSSLRQELFGFSINWVPVTVSNKNLLPWEGAAIWICEEGPPQIQLREHFFKTKLFQKDREEFLSHEAVHAARMVFDEPQFEEILAYQTSKNRFRKFWGPLFRSPKESLLFMSVLALSLTCGWFLPWQIYLLPLSILAYFIVRLVRFQRIFVQCLKKTSLPFMLCLSDKEIKMFSQLSQEEIEAYVDGQRSFRQVFLRHISLEKFK